MNTKATGSTFKRISPFFRKRSDWRLLSECEVRWK